MALPVAPLASFIDNVNGVPSHALIVHFTVAIATGASFGGLLYALVPKFRRWLSLPLLAAGVLSVILGLITPASGESLEERVDESALLEKHTELGDQMGTILIAFGIILILTMVVVRYRGKGGAAEPATPTTLDRVGAFPGEAPRAFGGQSQLAAGLTVLTLVGSIISGIWIVRTGHAGAKSVYDDTPTTPVRSGG